MASRTANRNLIDEKGSVVSNSVKDQILSLWSLGYTADQICDQLYCDRSTVFRALSAARNLGDARANRRAYQMPAKRKALKIAILASINANTKFIANTVGLSTRMVQIRLRELA
jgi:hypothetical protein